ncbi:MAG: Unknown protein [uncultured Sulfurovum sp.]|uniref:DUF4395 domain-containing protein n=1 Tax=uncultured Sulfurovum sp. TaxID=269237 RepID=A0A6S6U506_9BACT|nr:MAG: Unknown protein [uncultured Sulfurovum sp.]
MKTFFNFGEKVEGYDIPILNEREARAAAGILLVFALTSFFNSYLLHDFRFTKIFVTVFMIDFFIRIFINPRFAPSLILGRMAVRHQKPEYVGAPQKRFAWGIGFVLAVVMFFIIVVFEFMTPIKIAICLLCIFFLFSESAFGICVGCKVYHLVYKKNAKYCPGEVCEMHMQAPIQKTSLPEFIIAITFLAVTGVVTYTAFENKPDNTVTHEMKCGAQMKCQSAK